MDAGTLFGPYGDRVRQVLNVVLALAQPLASFVVFYTGTSFEESDIPR